MSITVEIDRTFSTIAQRIATLDPSLNETTAKLLQHSYNDIASDLDALKAKVDRFAHQIDAVEHDNARAGLVAEAEARFAKVIQDIKQASTSAELATGRKIVDTLDLWG